MKIYTEGARFWGGQIDRVDQGFKSLGHELTQNIEEADLVYSNNGLYDKIIEAKTLGKIKGKIILNVLDLAPHTKDFPLDKTTIQLAQADAVTCISATVQKDIKLRIGFNAHIIYNPSKPITRQPNSNRFFALLVGRVNDSEKRVSLGIDALNKLNVPSNQVVTTGGEYPFYGGRYVGISSDEQLNLLYNSAEFLICPTRNAFLGLPILEACAAGVIPVFAHDLDIREEFFPSNIFPEYAEIQPNGLSLGKFIYDLWENESKRNELKDRLYNYYKQNLEYKLSPIGVANAILDVYSKIK